ncbi:MAG: helix-turn-helix domain-containing protein [Deltaproteobacteria bacterium]|nr:helix-turn-helix domain-containing protein [Deltaproteobacteria bacterium]
METKVKRNTFNILTSLGFSLRGIVSFILKETGIKKSDLAKQAGVTPQYVNMVLAGSRTSAKVQEAISQALGFCPWA